MVGKYVDLPDAYLSVVEALRAGAFAHRAKVHIRWVASDSCETPAGAAAALAGLDGVVIPGGFGIRGIEGKVGALQHVRENFSLVRYTNEIQSYYQSCVPPHVKIAEVPISDAQPRAA